MRKLLLFFLTLTLVAACTKSNGPAPNTKKKLTIAVIPKGTTHEFWKSIHAGSLKAANELTAEGTQVEVIWKGPLREDDREQQIQVVEGFAAQGVSGIVLAPLDNRALVRPVADAERAGVPTVIIDSGLESEDFVSFVATDNRKGGSLAADRMGQLLNGKGKVLLLRYAEGSASTTEREEGFLETIKKFPDIQLISTDQYAGATRDTAKRASENLLNRFGDDVEGIFTPNESSTAGMLLALQDIGKAGALTFVGFDYSARFLEPLRTGQLKGFVVQNPINMGYQSVRTMVEHLRGRTVAPVVDTGVMMVTLDNLDDP